MFAPLLKAHTQQCCVRTVASLVYDDVLSDRYKSHRTVTPLTAYFNLPKLFSLSHSGKLY